MATICNTPAACGGGTTPTTCGSGTTPTTCGSGTTPTPCAGGTTPTPCTHNLSQVTVNAKCTTSGSVTEKCSKCCYSKVISTTPALGHKHGLWADYNCSVHKRVCTVCGGDPQTEAHATSGTCKCSRVITVPVQSVTIYDKKLDLSLAEEYTFKATVNPKDATNQTISWSSSNNDILTVSTDGKVKAIAPGTATITAYAGGYRAECLVSSSQKVSYLKIYQSPRLAGYAEGSSSIAAPDMVYGKTSKANLYKLSMVLGDLANQYHESIIINGPQSLKNSFHDLATIFSVKDSKMASVAHDMVNHFLDGTGTAYRNDTLTNKAVAHASTQRYINGSKTAIINALRRNKGNIGALLNDSVFKDDMNKNVGRPNYDEFDDNFNGLKITIHDTWGNYIEIINYSFNGSTFSGTLRFTIYDHFGLDSNDVSEGAVGFISGYTKQFGSWYVLQHYEGCNPLYKPFITYIETDVNFSERI